jgi:hypothetical protein
MKSWHWVAWLAVWVLGGSAALAQAPPSIADQLAAQYKLVKMGTDSKGASVIEEGTVLDIQKGGILGTPWGSPKSCPAKFANEQLQPPGKACTMMRGTGGKHGFGMLTNHLPGAVSGDVNSSNTNTSDTQYFKVGDKVYPMKIAVDMKNERIAFSIVACDSCNKTDPPTAYKSEVDFQFASGFLETGDVSKIEDTIAEVFTLDNGGQQAQGGQDQGQAQAQGGQDQAQAQAQPAAAPAAAPAAPAAPAVPAGPALSNDDVIKMVKAKVPDSAIIIKIKNSNCTFDTGADGLVKLQKAGVSEAVIDAMVAK